MNLCFPKPKMCRAPVEKETTATITNSINNNIDLQQTDSFFLFKKKWNNEELTKHMQLLITPVFNVYNRLTL